VVGWQRIIGSLPGHIIAHAIASLLLRWSVGIVRQVRRSLVGHGLRYRHSSAARDERLGFGVEGMSIKAPRYWVLAFRVSRIGSAR
jgi:uncharacterized membrane protein